MTFPSSCASSLLPELTPIVVATQTWVDGLGVVLAECGRWMTCVGDSVDLDAGLAEGLLGLHPGVVVEAEMNCKYWIQIRSVLQLR